MEWFLELNKLVTSMPLIGGTLSVTFGAAIVGLFWKGPAYLSRVFRRNFTVRFTINNSGYGPNVSHYLGFLKWYSETDCFKYTRAIAYEGSWKGGATGPGVGVHYVFYRGRLFWIDIVALPSQGSDKEKREITINTFGFNYGVFDNLFAEFKSDEDDANIQLIRKFDKDWWRKVAPLPVRDWSTVILNNDTKEDLTKSIDEFLVSKQWYRDRGIPYKLVILLYGPPGTGKTSIIKALANKYKKNIGLISLHTMSDNTFPLALETIPQNTFIAIEDFDTAGAVKKRDDETKKEENLSDLMDSGLNLSTILNTLDGIVELDGQVIFMSTNHIEKLDAALIRPGRVDVAIPIPALGREEVLQYANLAYPGHEFDVTAVSTVTGSKLQELVLKNKSNPEGFQKELNSLKEERLLSVVNE